MAPTYPSSPPLLTIVLLEELFCPKPQDVVHLSLGEGGGAGSAAHPRPHDKVSQHHLSFGHLGDPLLHRTSRHETVDHHLVGLTNPVSSTEGLT